MEQLDLERLERMIDTTSVAEVLAELAAIAYEKAEHVQTHWQDPILARAWVRAANRLTALQSQIDV